VRGIWINKGMKEEQCEVRLRNHLKKLMVTGCAETEGGKDIEACIS
jgi:hypothetical protein